jgi:curved DNA-binding protein CbpA
MSFEIVRGLFALSVTDHHAILGIPLNSDPKAVRQRYLQIAPLLHPDTCPATNPTEKELAKQLMSKLVNPAYATLSNAAKRQDHEAVLRTVAGRLPQQMGRVQITSDVARQLTTAANFEQLYTQQLRSLAAQQYGVLADVMVRIAEASELNLAYLSRVGTKGAAAPAATPAAAPRAATASAPAAAVNQALASEIEGSLRRANELLVKGQTAMAVHELKEALKRDGNSAPCHALLGKSYLEQNQTTLAKVHLSRALSLEPTNAIAIAAKRELDRRLGSGGQGQTAKGGQTGTKATQQAAQDKGKSGGLFGGLFGRKK